MDLSLSVCFSTAGYSVVESADYLLVGFRVGAVDMLVKEVWNTSPLTRQDMAGYYAELSEVGRDMDAVILGLYLMVVFLRRHWSMNCMV